jgi:hypothetical protein
MGLTPLTQTNIAFKNIIGQALGSTANDWYVESKPISFNIGSDTVWLDTISSTPSIAVSANVALNVIAGMTGISETITAGQYHAYLLIWPPNAPGGTDSLTGYSYSYGNGSLSGIYAGSTVRNIIPDKYGVGYRPTITLSDNSILNTTDSRSWYLQYNAGVYYQDIIAPPNPATASVYVYVGNTLKSRPNTPYTNTNLSQVSVGGITTYTSFNTVTNNSIFDMLLYPSLQPSFSSFTIQNLSSPYEVGNTSIPLAYTMSWTIANSASITSNSIYIYGITGSKLYGPTNNSGIFSSTFSTSGYSIPTTITYSITAQTTAGIIIQSYYNIKWNYGVYYGASTQSLLTTYGGFYSYQKNLNGTINGSYILPGGTFSTYKYILVPDSFSAINNITWNNIPLAMADNTDGYTSSVNNLYYNYVNFNNFYGKSSNYKIYRTKNMMAATMSNVIIS